MLMLDSDVIIWLLRGKPEVMGAFEAALRWSQGNVCISPVQVAEICAGIRDKEHKKVEAVLSIFRIIPIDEHCGILAGGYLRIYAKSHAVTLSDAFIAATALTSSALLWTMNTKHFPMLPEKTLYSPDLH